MVLHSGVCSRMLARICLRQQSFLASVSKCPPTVASVEKQLKRSARLFCSNAAKKDKNIKVVFHQKGSSPVEAFGKEGDTLLDLVVDNDLPFDGYGACEGTLACSTCHVILKQSDFDKLPHKPSDEEMDMLDLAYGLCETSRLGCQIELSKELDGIEVEVPPDVSDARDL